MQLAIKKIFQAYGLDPLIYLAQNKGYRNNIYPAKLVNGSWVNLVIYKREAGIVGRIKNANAVSEYLYKKGFPVRVSVDPRVIRITTKQHIRYAVVYNYLPGNTIPWESYTRNHIKALGMVMSNMHAELKSFPGSNLPNISQEYLLIINKMELYFADPGVSKALACKLNIIVSKGSIERLARVLHIADSIPGGQALHMDFVRGNILFQNSNSSSSSRYCVNNVLVSGIIDFEKAGYGHPYLDIARTLAFLLVDCKFKDAAKVRKYFLHSGYSKRGSAGYHNIIIKSAGTSFNLLEELVNLFLLYDFYKFLKHNPYESLFQNEHFTRTRDMLITRNVIGVKMLK